MTYAYACVSDCEMSMVFTCTDLLGALLRAAGSNGGVRHGDVWVFRAVKGLRASEMGICARS